MMPAVRTAQKRTPTIRTLASALLAATEDRLTAAIDVIGLPGRLRLRAALVLHEDRDSRALPSRNLMAACAFIDAATYDQGHALVSSRTILSACGVCVHWSTAEKVARLLPGTYAITSGRHPGERWIRNVKIAAERNYS